MGHDCEYIVDFAMDSEGEPVFCGLPANIKFGAQWFCAPHYDEIAERHNEHTIS
jgi:hypothetical protein